MPRSTLNCFWHRAPTTENQAIVAYRLEFLETATPEPHLPNLGEKSGLALHPTVKPVALVADALLDCSARAEIVVDCFLGSGSTLIAAERVGRICYGIEIDPLYVDVVIRRWQKHTGDFTNDVRRGAI